MVGVWTKGFASKRETKRRTLDISALFRVTVRGERVRDVRRMVSRSVE